MDKKNHKFRDRRGEILFIDARNMGVMIDRRHRELTDEEINKISSTYHVWRSGVLSLPKGKPIVYQDILGFCKSTNIEEIRKNLKGLGYEI